MTQLDGPFFYKCHGHVTTARYFTPKITYSIIGNWWTVSHNFHRKNFLNFQIMLNLIELVQSYTHFHLPLQKADLTYIDLREFWFLVDPDYCFVLHCISKAPVTRLTGQKGGSVHTAHCSFGRSNPRVFKTQSTGTEGSRESFPSLTSSFFLSSCLYFYFPPTPKRTAQGGFSPWAAYPQSPQDPTKRVLRGLGWPCFLYFPILNVFETLVN